MLSSLGSHAKELKQQGAVEAAQDENDPVTAQDAEKVMVDESKKGGAAAFQFDPDASPEEKAAQAGAVRNLALLFPLGLLTTCKFTACSLRVSSQDQVRSRYCD